MKRIQVQAVHHLELACYKFQAPDGIREAETPQLANAIRLQAGDYNITEEHLADALETLMGEGEGVEDGSDRRHR